jgi:hypothetical protein
MQKSATFLILVFVALGILAPSTGSAKLGVGVGTGKITFDKPLRMGGIYAFPSLTVINTGDESADYSVSVEYQEGQKTLNPPKEWITFSPETFRLDPGQSQVVKIQASIPLKATPGDYFAFLSGHPIARSNTAGGATIGISAAAKMYFTIAPANIFQAIYYRVGSIMKNNAPWSYVILIVIAASFLVVVFTRYFSFNLGVSRKSASRPSDEK